MMKKLLASLLVLTASGCPDVKTDENEEGGGPTVEFDPARTAQTGARFIPFPNDLARSPTTGKISLSAPQCPETAAAINTRTNVLNQLDGFGTYQLGMQVTFTDPVDPASIVVDPMSNNVNVVMYQVANAGAPLDPTTAMPIPLIVRSVGRTLRQSPPFCENIETVNAVVFVPAIPLRQKSTYVVALKEGITNTLGEPFKGSFTWGLVSAEQSPVTLDENNNVIADRTPLDPSDQADRASLISLARLWAGHKPALDFLDATPNGPASRSELLVAFAFTTQTTTDQLDPTVPTSPAGMLSAAGFLAPFQSIAQNPAIFPAANQAFCAGFGITNPAHCFLALALGGCKPFTSGCTSTHAAIGASLCQAPGSAPLSAGLPAGTYDCAQVGGILASAMSTQNYQTQVTNPLPASPGVTVGPIQGAWDDPVNPTSTGALTLQTIATIPAGTAPTGGWPVVIFGHALTGSKENVFAITGSLSRMGFAVVAIDFSQHGSRLSRRSTSVALGCKGHCFNGTTDTGVECETIAQCGSGQTCGLAPVGGTSSLLPPNGTDNPQCYTPIFSGDLEATRDNIRQTVLDLERLSKAIKTCTGTTCGAFSIDPARIYYGGVSLGSIIGTIPSAMVADIKAASLSVGGVGLMDVVENTAAVALRCSLVNALIDAGVLTGAKWTGGATGLCLEGGGNAWKAQSGYATFSSIARWVLDPADPANFAARLRMKPHLIQKVVDDAVIPNIATDRQAALSGASANTAASSPFAGAGVASTAITTNPTQSKLITYTSDTNHLFGQTSVLRPAALTAPGFAGTWRIQADFSQYLDNNDDNNN